MKTVIPFVAILTFTGSSFGATALSLQEAKDRVGLSPRIAASQASVDEAHAATSMSTGIFFPSLTARESFTLTNDPVGAFGAKLRQGEFKAPDFDLNELNRPESVANWTTRLELYQPILQSTTAFKDREAARSSEEAAGLRHDRRLQEMRFAVARIYYAATALSERQKPVGEGIDLLEKLEKSYQLMSAPTAATTTNFLITQSVRLGLAAQKRSLLAGETGLKRDLAAMLGLPAGEEMSLTDPLPPVPAVPADSVGKMSSERPDVKAAEKDAEAASSVLSAARGEWGPTLDAVGGYNIHTGKWADFRDTYDVGLTLNWPIFRGPRFGKIDGARARLNGAREAARSVRLEAESSLMNAESDFAARTEEYRLIQSAESKASEAFTLGKKRYAEGILSLFDYSQSIRNWVASRQDLVEAQRRVAEAGATLLFERGAL